MQSHKILAELKALWLFSVTVTVLLHICLFDIAFKQFSPSYLLHQLLNHPFWNQTDVRPSNDLRFSPINCRRLRSKILLSVSSMHSGQYNGSSPLPLFHQYKLATLVLIPLLWHGNVSLLANDTTAFSSLSLVVSPLITRGWRNNEAKSLFIDEHWIPSNRVCLHISLLYLGSSEIPNKIAW